MSSVPQNVIKPKVGLLNLAAELGNVSRACKVMGFSRDTSRRTAPINSGCPISPMYRLGKDGCM
jgi:hypothetical protein